jgi:hypothetical protein
VGRGSLIFKLLVLGVLVYVGAKLLPYYLLNYEVKDHISQLAVRATATHASAEAIRGDTVDYAQSLDLPVKRNNVTAEVTGSKVSIVVSYDVPVDLTIYTVVLHFAPSAESRFL